MSQATRKIEFRVGLRVAAVFAVLGLLSFVTMQALAEGDGLADRFADWGPVAALVLIPLHALVAVSPVPGEAVAVANSMLFGFWWGSLSNWIGWMLAAMAEYWLVRGLTTDFVGSGREPRLPKWLKRLPISHPIYLIVVRWVPFGGHVVNVTAGAGRVDFMRHCWCSAVSIIPVAMLFAGLAAGLVQILRWG
jgi:uncharacterized membrane protein YdjX (TVP38/TMEM64 family)